MVALEFHQPGTQRGARIAQANAEVEMIRIIGLAVVLISLSKITLAADDPAYVAPPSTGDPKSTIVSGILMIVVRVAKNKSHSHFGTFRHGRRG